MAFRSKTKAPWVSADEIGKWQEGMWTARGSGTSFDTTGILVGMGVASSSTSAISNDTGLAYQVNTDSVINSQARNSISANWDFGIYDFSYKFALTDITNVRFFGGITPNGSGVNLSDETQETFGIQFSPSRGDTTFQFISQDTSNPQGIEDSLLAADTDPYVFNCRYEKGVGGTYQIWNCDNEILLSEKSINTNPVTVSTGDEFAFGVIALAAEVKGVAQYFIKTKMNSAFNN